MKKYLAIFMVLFAVFSLSLAPPAKAEVISLALVMDGSGSITPADWTLQKAGYVNALNALIPLDGSIGLSVIQFATTVTTQIAYTVINNAATLTAFTTALSGITQLGTNTNISGGIQAGLASLSGAAAGSKKIIDVSTDGAWNVGVDPAGPAGTTGTALWAVANGISRLNVLGIGASAVTGWNAGTGSFSMTAANFAAFNTAIADKIHREVTSVPEPSTLLLLGSGMVGLWINRKRYLKG